MKKLKFSKIDNFLKNIKIGDITLYKGIKEIILEIENHKNNQNVIITVFSLNSNKILKYFINKKVNYNIFILFP